MDNLSTPLIAELDAVAVPVVLAMGEVLFQTGDPGEGAYVIRTGRIALTRSDNGKVYPMGTRGPKSIIGLPAVLNGSYSLSAMALEDSTFGFIPSSSVVGLLDYFPRLLSEALKMLAQELARVRPMIAGTGGSPVYGDERRYPIA
jgi:CRP-like cAMP-binding protein